MLSTGPTDRDPAREELLPGRIAPLLAAAVVVGSGIGILLPGLGQQAGRLLPPTVLLLVTALFFEARLDLRGALRAWRVVGPAWSVNFGLVPVLAYVISSTFVGRELAAMLGLFIYFAAPCTDWFLGFTRIAGGNIVAGSVLLPINMVTQLAAYPLMLSIFFGHRSGRVPDVGFTVLIWFALPFVAARLGRMVAASTSASCRRD
ncbi:hypothetical protein GCM10027613_46660 [Microlunatus endophyticus]